MEFKKLISLFAAGIVVATSCTEDDNKFSVDVEEGSGLSKFVIAATSSVATYLLPIDNLEDGEATYRNGAGYEVENATDWIFWNNKYAYRLVYNQQNPGVTTSYMLNSDGNIVEREIQYSILNRFTTSGIYNNHIVMAASGATAKTDDKGNAQYGVTFTLLNVVDQTEESKTIITENMIGSGEYCTLSGVVQSNNKIYTAVCPEGVSVYGVQNNGALLSDEAKAIINTSGGISGTINPDSVWVAIYDGVDFSNPRIVRDGRISYSTSRYRSQYYSTISADASGNVYVFSSSYATVQAGIQKTSLPSGVIRINAGTETFDADYYVNFEDESVAGTAMYKVWHIKEDYFLMQMYAEKSDDKSYTANTNKLGVFKASDKSFTWVTGLPGSSEINSLSKNAYSDGENAFIVVTPVTTNAKPTIYKINPLTAAAEAGVVVDAEGVTAIGKLIN